MNRPNAGPLDVASAIAHQLDDPKRFATGPGRRRPQSLSGGAAGIALLHIERARAGQGDWSTAHAWLSAAARDELSAGANASLFFGVPTLAFVTHAAANPAGTYERAKTRLDAATITVTHRRLSAAHERMDRGDRPTLTEFDIIRGLTGLASYHLLRHPHHDVTGAVLDYLVRLTEPLPGNGPALPGWWTDVAPHGAPSPDFPGGHGNVGMSHGIAAPLALLALALRQGVTVHGQTEAIGRICGWMDTWRQEHPAGPWWPGIITRQHVDDGHIPPASQQRPSWCYGVPGIARAQQLAGHATADIARRRTAETAMLGCLRDSVQLGRINGSGLCHGTAGMVQAAWRMATDTDDPDMEAELQQLTDRLLAKVDPTAEDVEFLDGTAGVALALLTAGTDTAPHTAWDRCLLLA